MLQTKEYWLSQSWGTLRLDSNQCLPLSWSSGSGKNMRFLCSCGRNTKTTFYSINKRNTQSCGKCSLQKREVWLAQKWSRLKLDSVQPLPEEWAPKSTKRFIFTCDCGRNTTTSFQNVTSGHSVSCGNCTAKPKEYWLSQKWDNLKLDPEQELPKEWGPAAHKQFIFICDCGRTSRTFFGNVEQGFSKSCGKCPEKSKDFWLSQRWGKLRLDPSQDLPQEWARWTERLFKFSCECGRTVEKPFGYIYSGNFMSCAGCSNKSKNHWLSQTWGKLKLDPSQNLPDEWSASSKLQVTCLCSCGKNSIIPFFALEIDQTKSCTEMPKEYWLKQKWGKLRLDPNQSLPEEWAPFTNTRKFKFICDCGGLTEIVFGSAGNNTNSCGCIRPGLSKFSPAYKIYDFVSTLDPTAKFSHWFNMSNGGRLEYDVYLPARKIAIEYHGLIWHSERFASFQKDYKKYQNALQEGDRLIQIYEDEWRDKEKIIKDFLMEIISPRKKKKIKPKFEILTETSQKARDFLEQNHYLGAASGCLTIVAKHKSEIVGVWVFMKREAGTVLWHRACWDHKYKAWNPHQKALEMAKPLLKQMGFRRILTFSDNRFHTGDLYEKLGFVFEKELKPDYSYTRRSIRISKYALRVPAGVNEVSSAAAQGWYRIWDSGKKRFAIAL